MSLQPARWWPLGDLRNAFQTPEVPLIPGKEIRRPAWSWQLDHLSIITYYPLSVPQAASAMQFPWHLAQWDCNFLHYSCNLPTLDHLIGLHFVNYLKIASPESHYRIVNESRLGIEHIALTICLHWLEPHPWMTRHCCGTVGYPTQWWLGERWLAQISSAYLH